MYNKIFTKILDSSIWLEPDATRIVWLTLIAAMDEDGFCQFASAANLAHRARVSLQAAQKAISALESDDPNSSDPDHGGRRIERMAGGWVVLNAAKYREIVSRVVHQQRLRDRVRKHRAKKAAGNALVTTSNAGNAKDRIGNESVTQSESESESESEARERKNIALARVTTTDEAHLFQRFYAAYPKKKSRKDAEKAWAKIKPSDGLTQKMLDALAWQRGQPEWIREGGKFIPHPATWLNNGGWEDEPFHQPIVSDKTLQAAQAVGEFLGAKGQA